MANDWQGGPRGLRLYGMAPWQLLHSEVQLAAANKCSASATWQHHLHHMMRAGVTRQLFAISDGRRPRLDAQ